MTTLAVAAFIAVLLAGGFLWHRDRRNLQAAHAKALAAKNEVIACKDTALAAVGRRAAVMEAASENFAAKLLTVRRERDTARAGLQAKLLHEARGDLLKPHDAVGTGSVIEFPRRVKS